MMRIAVFNLDNARFSGAHDPLVAWALCGVHADNAVMVDSDWPVRVGAIINLDLEQLIAEHSPAVKLPD